MNTTPRRNSPTVFWLGMAALLISLTLAATGCESGVTSSGAATLEAAQATATASMQRNEEARATQAASSVQAQSQMDTALAGVDRDRDAFHRQMGLLCLVGLGLLFTFVLLLGGVHRVGTELLSWLIRRNESRAHVLLEAARMQDWIANHNRDQG